MWKRRPQAEAWQPNWAYVSEAELEFLLSEAKEYLAATVEMDKQANEHAAAFCGVFGAGAFASFTIAASLFSGQDQNSWFTYGAMVVGFMLLAAFAVCVVASRPANIYVGGYEPQRLFPATRDEIWMRRYTVEDIQARILANRGLIETRGRVREAAVVLALSAVLVLFITVVAGLVFSPHGRRITGPASAAGSVPAVVVEMNLPVLSLSSTGSCSRCDLLNR